MIVFLCILIIITMLITIFVCSYIEIDLENIEIENFEKIRKIIKILFYEKDNIKKLDILDYISLKVKIKILFLNKIPILVIKKNNYQIKDMILKQYDKEMKKSKKEIEKDKKKAKKVSKNIVKRLEIKSTKFNMELGTEDAAFTAIASSIVNIAISIALPHVANADEMEKFIYNVKPIYLSKNVFFLQFSGIIALKIVHIMNVICKKEEKVKYE